MKRMFRAISLIVLVRAASFAQPPAWEAADAHVSAVGSTESGAFLPGGRMEFRATSLLRLIALAYSVPPDRVAGGPNWLDTDRFDVIAKAATAASPAAMRTMLQSLLAERFQLAIRREEKPQPVFALTPGKRVSLKASSAPDGEPECKAGSEENLRTVACRNMTVAGLAERLQMLAPGYFNLPVLDRSEVKGAYDFTLSYIPRGQLPPGSENNPLSLFNVIEKQLGVKVERQTSPMPVVTIERVERTPAPNPPGVLEKLGPPPTEFEVADVKRSRPDETEDFQMTNGRINARAISLKEMITFAYDVEDDWVRGGEKWLETDRFNILAKTAPTASVDTLRAMLQSLLADRFRLKVHREAQPVTVYALTVGKLKLKEADPAARSTCKQSAADGARNLTCQNTTMAQFSERLRNAAAAYLDHPVVDMTGLKGAYDFTLSFAPRARLMAGGDRPPATDGAVPAASDRPVGYTVFEAVDRQLGLKLAAQKHPMQIVVIDRVERAPTEN